MLKIKVDDWYDLYRKHTFEFEEGVTCLIGKNGAGKSTLLKEIKDKLNDKKIKPFYYDNDYRERHAMSEFGFYGDFAKIARNMANSEGQNIRSNFEDYIPEIGRYIKMVVNKNQDKAIILLDGLDSGISLDYVLTLKKELFPIILEDCNKWNIECYIIISANNYEFCDGTDCIRVTDAKHFKFNTYEEFKKIYMG